MLFLVVEMDHGPWTMVYGRPPIANCQLSCWKVAKIN